MKIATWNVNGVRARALEVQSLLEREQPDVLCLQEIKASPAQVPEALAARPDYWSCWHGDKGYSGVALLLRKAAFVGRPRFTHPAFDYETRIVEARFGDLSLASIYVPNGGKDFEAKLRFLAALAEHAAQKRPSRVVLCGDLNVAREERDVHPKLRKRDQIGTTPVERGLLSRIVSHGLVDVARKFAPDDDELFTWWAPWRNQRERNIGWRIDFVLASAPLADRAQACTVLREFGTSDHGPLLATFDAAVPAYEEAPEPGAEAAPAAKAGQLPLL